jgi:hypothetical protein
LRGLLKNDKAGVDAQMAGKLLHDLLLQIRLAPVREVRLTYSHFESLAALNG